MKRRCLSILLVLCMVMTLLPTTAFAEEVTSGTCGENLTWTLDTNGGLTISGTGRMGNYSGSGGSSVAAGSPGAPWYAQRNMITTITIEEGVTSIGDWAFAGCGELTGVSIPDSVTTIGSYAFRYCTSLTSVEIGSSVTSIGDSAFYECRKLINVTIPSSVTDIGGTAFESSPWLAQQGEFVCVNGILLEYQGVGGNVVIPDSITSIGIKAFSSCSKLTSVTIPTSVTRIGNYAFMFCNNLTDIYFTGSKAQWQDIEIEYQFYEATIPQRATIHYDSTGPDGPVLNNTISVYFLSGWDATTRNAQFGDDEITPYTYTVADSIDVSNISSLLNKYVLVMLEQGDSSLEYTITDIQPVESKIGTVSTTGEHSLTIDGITYPVREDYVLALYDGKEVLYHVYNGTIMGFDVLEEKHGVLGSWNDATKKVTIGGAEYPTNYLTDFSFMDNIRDYFQKDVYFLIADSSGYCPMIKITGLYSPGANMNEFNADIYQRAPKKLCKRE